MICHEDAWSWHIWVTDHDLRSANLPLTPHTTVAYRQRIMKENLGWVDTRIMSRYDGRTVYVRLVQDDPDGAYSEPILLTQKQGPTKITYGNSPYYAWGRKDPFPGFNGDYDAPLNKPVYPSAADNNPYAPQYGLPGRKPIEQMIREPYIQYLDNGYTYSSPTWYNLWNSTGNYSSQAQANSEFITKSAYDPSPVGYKVPNIMAWDGLKSGSNTKWVAKEDDEQMRGPGRVYPATGVEQIFFPAVGERDLILANVGLQGMYTAATGYLYTAASIWRFHRMRFREDMITIQGGETSDYTSVRCTPDE